MENKKVKFTGSPYDLNKQKKIIKPHTSIEQNNYSGKAHYDLNVVNKSNSKRHI